MRRMLAAATIAALCAGGLVAAAPAFAASTAAHPSVQGNRLVDARTGATFVPRGANWPSFEYACWQGWGYSGGASANEAALMASWKINTVRIPLNQDCWLGLNGSPAGSGRTVAGYRTAVETFVTQLNAVGIVAILDLHSSAPAGYAAHGQRAMPDSQSRAFWTSVATRFSANPAVMFDIFNEPYSRSDAGFALTWACWRDGGCQAPVEDDYTSTVSGAKYTVVGMNELVGLVRAAGATQPVLLGGLNYSNDLTQWLAFKPSDPQVAVSWHNYAGQGCGTSCWNSTVTTLAASVPIVMTEFGQNDGGNAYLISVMNWADAHGIGYLPWAWWRVDYSEDHGNSYYALVDDSNQPKYPSGTALHDHLAALPPDPGPSPSPTPDPSPAAPTVARLAGADRYSAAVAVSRTAFPATAPIVFVATGENYPDALSAGAVAATLGGPLLLTTHGALPPVVVDEITRLHPARIVVVGGPASVGDAVLGELTSIQPNTHRISGPDRYSVSLSLASYGFAGGASLAYVTTGTNFPDALSAAGAGGHAAAPVILVDGSATGINAATRSALVALGVQRIVIAGGPASVSAGVAAALATVAPTSRLWGPDRFTASQAINAGAYTSATDVILATGMKFPDALAASAWAGRIAAPLYVVPASCVPQPVLTAIDNLGADRVWLVGGEASLSQAVFDLVPC